MLQSNKPCQSVTFWENRLRMKFISSLLRMKLVSSPRHAWMIPYDNKNSFMCIALILVGSKHFLITSSVILPSRKTTMIAPCYLLNTKMPSTNAFEKQNKFSYHHNPSNNVSKIKIIHSSLSNKSILYQHFKTFTPIWMKHELILSLKHIHIGKTRIFTWPQSMLWKNNDHQNNNFLYQCMLKPLQSASTWMKHEQIASLKVRYPCKHKGISGHVNSLLF